MSRKQTTLEEELESAVYTDRLLVFLECEEGFRQVILTPEQFKKLGDVVIHQDLGTDADGLQKATFNLNLDKAIPKEKFEFMTDYE